MHKSNWFAAVLAAVLIAGCDSTPSIPRGPAMEYSFGNTRDARFGEILVARGGGFEVYNTTGLNNCPARVWDAIDTERLAKQLHVEKVIKHGPRYWMMDEQSLVFGRVARFDGLQTRWAGTSPLRINEKQAPYTIFKSMLDWRMVYYKGRPVYELIDPDGNNYVMEAHDEQHPMTSLATMGDEMKKLPAGWKYQTRILTENLALDLTPKQTSYVVSDEFNQYYARPPKTK